MPKDENTLTDTTNPSLIVQEVISRSGFMVMMKTQVIEALPGRVCLEIKRAPHLLQFDGLFHGGVIASLADYAGACAAAVSSNPGVPVLTSSLNVTYLNAARGAFLRAEANCIKTGSRLRTSRVEVFCDDESEPQLVAVANVTISVNAH